MNECIFCKIIKGEIPSYKVYEDENVLSFLSNDPVTYGHTLVIPKKHYKDYEDIDLETLNHINEKGKEIYNKIKENLNPDGIKLVQNNGCVQEIKHYHLHILPIFHNEPDNKTDFETITKNITK